MNKIKLSEKELIGKIISDFQVDGSSVVVRTTDGSTFEYDASDGGYSLWETYKEEMKND